MTTHLLSKGAASSGLPDINKENKKKTRKQPFSEIRCQLDAVEEENTS